MVKEVNVIVAISDRDRSIAKNGKTHFRVKEDMDHFRELTRVGAEGSNAAIFGRVTALSMGKFFPLKGMRCAVISSLSDQEDNLPRKEGEENKNSFEKFGDLGSAISTMILDPKIERVWIMGGQKIYEEVFDKYLSWITNVYVTTVYNVKEGGDRFFPAIPSYFLEVGHSERRRSSSDPSLEYTFSEYYRPRVVSQQK